MIAAAIEQDRLAGLRERLAVQPEVAIAVGDHQLLLRARHGLFSARSLDEGTAMLLRELEPLPAPSRVLDLGCGYGAIGLTLAAKWPNAQVLLVDTDIRAVDSTLENIAGNCLENASAALSDGIGAVRELASSCDLVVANLPAQAGNDALDQLLLDGYDALTDDGLLVAVAVNGLRRYLQRRLAEIFGRGNAAKVRQGPRHTVLEAVKLSA